VIPGFCKPSWTRPLSMALFSKSDTTSTPTPQIVHLINASRPESLRRQPANETSRTLLTTSRFSVSQILTDKGHGVGDEKMELPVCLMRYDMQVRKAELADADKMSDLLTQLGYPETQGFIREKIMQLNDHPDEELVVAVEAGEVLGFISIHLIPQIALPGAFARISYLCVDEGARSRGIGGQLESYCESLARERHCDRIEVHCHSRRERAHKFYSRQGYKESPKYLMKKLD
jgi:GNAT superfamily N-acetyltransferase